MLIAMQPMFRDAAKDKLIRLERHLIKRYHLTSLEATRINEWVKKEFVLPYAIERAHKTPPTGDLYVLPCAVENSGRKSGS